MAPLRGTGGRAVAALVAVQTLFGLHYLASKAVVREIPPAPWSLIRAAAGGLLLLAFAAALRLPLPRGRGAGRRLASLAGLSVLGVAVNQYLFAEGIHRTTPGHSAVINTSIPVLVLAMAVLAGRERPTRRRLAGIALTLLGVLALIGRQGLDSTGAVFRGDLLTLGNAASYSLFLVLGKPVLERERTLPGTALLLGFGSLWLLPVGAPGLARLSPQAIGTGTWLLAAFIVIGPTAGAYALNTYALRRVDSSLVALFIYLQPVIGAGLSVALGMEPPTLRLFLAGSVVLAGITLALRSPVAPGPPPPEGRPARGA